MTGSALLALPSLLPPPPLLELLLGGGSRSPPAECSSACGRGHLQPLRCGRGRLWPPPGAGRAADWPDHRLHLQAIGHVLLEVRGVQNLHFERPRAAGQSPTTRTLRYET